MLNTCPILSALKHNLHFLIRTITIFLAWILECTSLYMAYYLYIIIYFHIFLWELRIRILLLRVLRRRGPTQRIDKGYVIDKGTKYISSIQRLRKVNQEMLPYMHLTLQLAL